MQDFLKSYLNISIHAPTKGATQATQNAIGYVQFQSTLPRRERPNRFCCIIITINYFNPRSHEGSDLEEYYNGRGFKHFNPRSHEGSDGISREKFCPKDNFNPRSHEGSDDAIFTTMDSYMISIHAPTKGATYSTLPYWQGTGISIHAPTKGATSCICSNPHTKLFQSTLPRRERLICIESCSSPKYISIHAPTKGATCHY